MLIPYCKHPENLQPKHIPQLMFITRFYAQKEKKYIYKNTLTQHPGGYIQKNISNRKITLQYSYI